MNSIVNENGKLVFSDYDLSSPIACSAISISYPFKNYPQFKRYEQEYAQLIDYYQMMQLGSKARNSQMPFW